MPRMRREARELGDSIEDLGSMLKDLEREIDAEAPRRPATGPSLRPRTEIRIDDSGIKAIDKQLADIEKEIEKMTASITDTMTDAQLDKIEKRLDELTAKAAQLESKKKALNETLEKMKVRGGRAMQRGLPTEKTEKSEKDDDF
jgi:chromosome segregation ATPase